MVDTISEVGKWALGIVLSLGGFWLMISGVGDIAGALGGKTKEWGKAGLGLLVGVIGGFLIVIGVTQIISLFQKGGKEIPLK